MCGMCGSRDGRSMNAGEPCKTSGCSRCMPEAHRRIQAAILAKRTSAAGNLIPRHANAECDCTSSKTQHNASKATKAHDRPARQAIDSRHHENLRRHFLRSEDLPWKGMHALTWFGEEVVKWLGKRKETGRSCLLGEEKGTVRMRFCCTAPYLRWQPWGFSVQHPQRQTKT